ncbi:MAG: hypothetical protein ACOCZE_07355 [Planctomycetota bacterium]
MSRLHLTVAACVAAMVACPGLAWSAPPAAAPATAAQLPLADRLPGETLIYFGWAGRSLTFDGSMFGQLLNEPYFENVLASLRDLAGRKGPVGAAGTELLLEVLAKPFALSLVDGDSEEPIAVIAMELGEDSQGFGDTLAEVAKKSDLQRKTEAVEGVSFDIYSEGQEETLFVTTSGKTTWMTFSRPGAQAVAGISAEKSLASRESFVKDMTALAGQHVQIAVYADAASLKSRATANPGDGGRPMGGPLGLIEPLGLGRVRAVASVSNIVDKGILTRSAIYSPAPHRGVLGALAARPVDPAQMGHMPADTTFAAAMQVEADRILEIILAQLPPAQARQITEPIQQIKESMKVDVPALLANLNGTWTISQAASYGGAMTGVVATMQVRNEDALRADLAKIETIAGRILESNEMRPIQVHKTGRLEVHYIPNVIPDSPLAVSPSWAIHKGRLYVAPFPQLIVSAIDRAEAAPSGLTSGEAYQRIRSKLPDKAAAVIWSDYPASLRRGYGLLLLLNGMLAGEQARQAGFVYDPAWLPPLSRLEKYVWPSVTVMTHDETGIRFESYGSVPMLVGPVDTTTTPLLVSILLPSIARARSLAARTASQAQLSGMGQAIVMYESEKGRMPENYEQMIEMGLIARKMLYSPAGEHSGLSFEELERRKPPSDYIYIRPGAGVGDGTVMIYENPDNYGEDGTNVLFVNGSVRWVTMEEFRKLMARAGQGGGERDL